MLVGLLSDTHDRLDAATAAVRVLIDRGAEHLIHCGDIGSERVIDALAGHPASFVFGNNDWDRAFLERYAADVGVRCLGAFGELELGGRRLAVTHGDDSRLLAGVLDARPAAHDYLLVGHTHVRRDERIGTVRVINPGALYRAAVKTVALLDTDADAVAFHVVST